MPEALFVLSVLSAIRRRLIGARDLIIDSAPSWPGANASLAACFCSFTCSARQVALTYTASILVGLAAQQAGRPDLIRSPKRVLAHCWEAL